jgi:hypothetical protein
MIRPVTTEPSTLRALRRWLLILLGCGLAGTATELLLLGHDEDATQLVPLLVTPAVLAVLAWHTLAPGRASTRLFRVAMLALIACGAAGVWFHYSGNREFQLEMDPSMAGFDLLLEVLQAKAPPALAPGHMALLGLFGLAATYGQPFPAAVHHDADRGETA